MAIDAIGLYVGHDITTVRLASRQCDVRCGHATSVRLTIRQTADPQALAISGTRRRYLTTDGRHSTMELGPLGEFTLATCYSRHSRGSRFAGRRALRQEEDGDRWRSVSYLQREFSNIRAVFPRIG